MLIILDDESVGLLRITWSRLIVDDVMDWNVSPYCQIHNKIPSTSEHDCNWRKVSLEK